MNRTRTPRRAAATGVVVVGLLALGADPAAAHVTITASTTEAGATAVVRLVVPHGCAGAPTTKVAVRMPEGVGELTAASTEQWVVDQTAEGVTFRADAPLRDATSDEVAFSVRLPDDVGTELVFPVVQRCRDGESAWTEVAEDAASREELEMPAPVIVVTGDPARPVMTYGAVGVLATGTLAAGAVLLLLRRRRA